MVCNGTFGAADQAPIVPRGPGAPGGFLGTIGGGSARRHLGAPGGARWCPEVPGDFFDRSFTSQKPTGFRMVKNDAVCIFHLPPGQIFDNFSLMAEKLC